MILHILYPIGIALAIFGSTSDIISSHDLLSIVVILQANRVLEILIIKSPTSTARTRLCIPGNYGVIVGLCKKHKQQLVKLDDCPRRRKLE